MGDVVPMGMPDLPEYAAGYHLGRLRLLIETLAAEPNTAAAHAALVAEVDALDVAVHGLLAALSAE